ncbi:MAG: AMP-binding protein [Myxococcota bacterium]|nr:AMP-binding protein [Myxococcota bacterium]
MQVGRLYARALIRTGMIWNLRPSVLPVLVRQRLRGAGSGPSALIRLAAAARPDALAVVDGHRRYTYAEIDRRVDAIAAGMRGRLGLSRGSSAVLVMRNRVELLEAQAALGRVGASTVAASTRSTPAELEYLLGHSGASALFVDAELEDVARAAVARSDALGGVRIVVVGSARDGLVAYDELAAGAAAAVDDDAEAAVVIYTSGTTGRPKGAVRRFPREVRLAVLQFLLETPLRADDRHLVVCPMYHSTAFAFVGFTLGLGGTVVLAPRFEPEAFLETVQRERITTTAVVPTMLHRLCELPPEIVARYDTRSLRAVFSGGAPLSGPLARRFMERFGHVLYNFYGATETGINTIASPEELLEAPGTIGHVVPGNEIRLLDEEGRDVPPGVTGELYVRNAMLVAGYHRDEEATAASMRDGFFSVGDLAHRDERGLYFIDGRKRDMIISGGVNVYPAEVEQALLAHPAVAEAAVVGVPDEEWGERVRAFVALHAGSSVSAEELVAWARERLAGPKVPREIVILDELPKNPTGKVLKRELRARP